VCEKKKIRLKLEFEVIRIIRNPRRKEEGLKGRRTLFLVNRVWLRVQLS